MNRYGMIVGVLLLTVFIGACAARPMAGMEGEHRGMTGMETHAEGAGHEGRGDAMASDEHSTAAHGIPEEAGEMQNPVPVSDVSLAAGQATYTQYCATCHGPQGAGDGPAAAGLDPKPADFHAAHVQALPDGALFHVITHGRDGTAMVAWENILSEEQRWELVNFLRTFKP
ncbi:MAG: cytochrome c [Caldilineaceae bacterium]|nr:cytochrome c [Caldilineaceae bacterium]